MSYLLHELRHKGVTCITAYTPSTSLIFPGSFTEIISQSMPPALRWGPNLEMGCLNGNCSLKNVSPPRAYC